MLDEFSKLQYNSQVLLTRMLFHLLGSYQVSDTKKLKKNNPMVYRQMTFAQLSQSYKTASNNTKTEHFFQDNTVTTAIVSFLEELLPNLSDEKLLTFLHEFIHIDQRATFKEGSGSIVRRIRDLNLVLQSNPVYTNLRYSPPL